MFNSLTLTQIFLFLIALGILSFLAQFVFESIHIAIKVFVIAVVLLIGFYLYRLFYFDNPHELFKFKLTEDEYKKLQREHEPFAPSTPTPKSEKSFEQLVVDNTVDPYGRRLEDYY